MSDTQDDVSPSAQGVDESEAGGCPVAHDSATATRQREREPGDRLAEAEDRRSPAHEPGLVAQPARPLGAARPLVQGQPAGRGASATPEEFEKLDVEALKRDITEVLTTSQDWWPADFGHYGGLMIRMSWHAAGTYRIHDGRGGAGDGGQRFAPLNSWPDNANLDKARRLLWPVKQKYGQQISWADLLVLAGNVALESMGFKTFGFGFGRVDVWEPEEIFWGPEDAWLGDERYVSDDAMAEASARPRWDSSTSTPRVRAAARLPGGGPLHPGDLRPDGDERRGDRRPHRRRPHLRQDPRRRHRRRPRRPGARGRPAGDAGPGLAEHQRQRQGRRHDHQRPRGHLDRQADAVEQPLLRDPLRLRVGAPRPAPAARSSGSPRTPRRSSRTPTTRPRSTSRRCSPPTCRCASTRSYEQISRRFLENPDEFALAFAKAWYKLLHRDMGPVSRFLGPWVAEPQLWQDPVPAVDHELVGDADVAALKAKVLDSGLTTAQLVSTAWASAASFRSTDKRGGANGARIRLEPQRSWEVNQPEQLGDGPGHPRGHPAGVQRIGRRREDLARRPDRAGRLGRRREGGARRRRRGDRAVPSGPHRRHPGADRRRVVRGSRAARRRVPQLPASAARSSSRRCCSSTAPTCST